MWSAHHGSFEEIFFFWKEGILLFESPTYAEVAIATYALKSRSPLWTDDSPLWTGNRHFELAIRYFELAIATMKLRSPLWRRDRNSEQTIRHFEQAIAT